MTPPQGMTAMLTMTVRIMMAGAIVNRIRSTPISITQHSSAGFEKLPLVVIQTCLQK